ncbi:acetyl-CoA carboxylase [Escherichia coli]|uniref:acetyl-CoA carboxylase n=1 Tax=Escherichia coli TaxID=562 RepID=UPI001157AE10|nr:acetyl-CoA carboxylase [Escherichia coli]
MAVTEILSPLPGVFYRKPAPDSAPFLENGDTVQESTVIGLIEIMKQFNEIHVETTGTNIQFKVENGEEVEPGQVLATIEII